MAIKPNELWPGQTTVDAEYPHGKAQNITTPGDGSGTPLEKNWLNDIWGFLQGLLDRAGITASGNPDTVPVSQYCDAVKYIAENPESIDVQNDATVGGDLEVTGDIECDDLDVADDIFAGDDITSAAGDVSASSGNIRGQKVILLGTQEQHILRVAPCGMTPINDGVFVNTWQYRGMSGWRTTLESGNQAAIEFSFHLPKGSVLASIQITTQTEGEEETDELWIYERSADDSQETILGNDDVPHTNGSPLVYGVSVAHDDTQVTASAMSPSEMEFYVARWITKHDVTAGGSQFAFMKGARIGWKFENLDEMRMPT